MKKYEYVWLDGYEPEPFLRSKVKVTADNTAPEWSFDGSSTQQADTQGSDCILIPVQELESRIFELEKYKEDKKIIVYCRSGNRSQTGRLILSQNGFNRSKYAWWNKSMA